MCDISAKYKKSDLVLMCRQRGWSGYSKYKKAGLLRFVRQRFLEEHYAALKIQKLFRQWYQKLLRNLQIVNEQDIFTLEDFVPGVSVFKIRNSKFQIYQFDTKTFLKYVIESGKFSNPFTMEKLENGDLRRLKQKYFQDYPADDPIRFSVRGAIHTLTENTNIVQLQHAIKRDRDEEIEREQVRLHLENRCLTVIETIIDMISVLPSRSIDIVSQVEMYILQYHLPSFSDYYRDLFQLDEETARVFLKYILDLVGSIVLKLRPDALKVKLGLLVYNAVLGTYRRVFDMEYVDRILSEMRNMGESLNQVTGTSDETMQPHLS